MRDGRLEIGASRIESVRGGRDGAGFVDGAEPGDTVSLHWDWACERLTRARLGALQQSTVNQLAIANQTI